MVLVFRVYIGLEFKDKIGKFFIGGFNSFLVIVMGFGFSGIL